MKNSKTYSIKEAKKQNLDIIAEIQLLKEDTDMLFSELIRRFRDNLKV